MEGFDQFGDVGKSYWVARGSGEGSLVRQQMTESAAKTPLPGRDPPSKGAKIREQHQLNHKAQRFAKLVRLWKSE